MFKDIAIEKNVDTIIGDIIISSSNDLAEVLGERDLVLEQVKENFEMQPADDIDFPHIYSMQRAFQNAEDRLSRVERVADAKRMLKANPLVEPDTAEVTIVDGMVQIAFSLVAETEQERYIL